MGGGVVSEGTPRYPKNIGLPHRAFPVSHLRNRFPYPHEPMIHGPYLAQFVRDFEQRILLLSNIRRIKLGQAEHAGTFEYVGAVSEVWYADLSGSNLCFVSVFGTAGGGQVVLEDLPAGVASKENDSWTGRLTISADQGPTSFVETAKRKLRLRCTVLGTKGMGYRVQHGAAADLNTISS
jgi:hypothetical protein